MAAGKKQSYAGVRTTFENKMNAYKALCTQTTGSTSKFRPTPAQLNSFARWVDKGAIIQTVSNTQLNRWSGSPKTWTPGTVRTCLSKKFGKTCIKAVAYNKTGGFIVATSPTRKGRNFKFTVNS